MKLILTKSSLVFDRGATQISQKYGNEIQGMTLHAYFNADGSEYNGSSSVVQGITPFIDIQGLLSDIVITNSFANYTNPHPDVVFYASQNAADIVGMHTEADGGRFNPTISKNSVPTNAKYMRVACNFGSSQPSSYQYATEVTFTKGN